MKKQIYYSNITIEVHIRGNKWDSPQVITGVVVAGSDAEIKKDKTLLRKIAQKLKGKAAGYKFDLDRIRIIKIEKRWRMGLGFMHQEKNIKSKSIKN